MSERPGAYGRIPWTIREDFERNPAGQRGVMTWRLQLFPTGVQIPEWIDHPFPVMCPESHPGLSRPAAPARPDAGSDLLPAPRRDGHQESSCAFSSPDPPESSAAG
ncbi:hypothetical protein GCM10009527_062420 [Actinomadura nitritigenes]